MGICQGVPATGSGEKPAYPPPQPPSGVPPYARQVSSKMPGGGKKRRLDEKRPSNLAVLYNIDSEAADEESKADDSPLEIRRPQRNMSLPMAGSGGSNSAVVGGVDNGISATEMEKIANYARQGHRNSIVEYIESVRRLQDKQMDYIIKKRTGTLMDESKDNVVFLPRGGTYVPTPVGPIQFGLPPETIKDSMNMGLTLPSYYVLPKERFNLQTGINVAEFEFPAYFNFFILRKPVTLVIHKEVEPLIRTVFQETLLGPKEVKMPTSFSEAVGKDSYPDLNLEMAHFRKNPFDRTQDLSVDTLIKFIHFEEGVAKIGEDVTVTDIGEEFVVKHKGEILATVSGYVIISAIGLSGPGEEYGVLADADQSQLLEEEHKETIFFVPPMFGVTMLGNSHGFDAKGTTTGFVLWMNRRGIMVDPPPHSGEILKRHGIPSRLIHGVILSHCHADHDAGTFQKILEESRVVLYTTDVIADSFLTKYEAISGLNKEFLRRLFEFRSVMIGDKVNVYGGQLQFFYSLHSIPCVGFIAYCNNKTMVYSGDTFNDPDGIRELCAKGVMSPGRAQKLLDFPWHSSLILHEAGVPPIHTPMKTLISQPDDIKERLRVVHCAPKDVPAGLKPALVGTKNTIVISNERGPYFQAMEALDLVGSIDIFEDFAISRGVEILSSCNWVMYEKGSVLIEQGTYGDRLYVVAMGVVSVTVDGSVVKNLTVGDHFGEMSIVTGQKRTATIYADTQVELLEFRGNDFMHLVRNSNAVARLRHLGRMQAEESWQVINSNSVLQNMSSNQKTYLQSLLGKKNVTRGDIIWDVGDRPRFAVLVHSGRFVFSRAKNMPPFQRGAFVGDMHALITASPLKTTLVCAEDGAFFYITRKNLLKFFDDNPGVLVFFKDRRFVE